MRLIGWRVIFCSPCAQVMLCSLQVTLHPINLLIYHLPFIIQNHFITFKWMQTQILVIFQHILVIFRSLQVTLRPINHIYHFHLHFIIQNHLRTFKWIQNVLVNWKETTNIGHLPIYLGHLPQSVGHPLQSVVQPNVMYHLYHLPS